MLLGFIAGGLIVGGAVYLLLASQRAAEELTTISAVEVPMRKALEEVVRTFDDGKTIEAEAKVRLLEARWQAYAASHDPADLNRPDEIHLAVQAIAEDSASPATRPR